MSLCPHVPHALTPTCLYPYVPRPTPFSPHASRVPCPCSRWQPAQGSPAQPDEPRPPGAGWGTGAAAVGGSDSDPAPPHCQGVAGWSWGHRGTWGHGEMCHQAAVWNSWTPIPVSSHHLVPVSPCPCVTPSFCPHVPPVSPCVLWHSLLKAKQREADAVFDEEREVLSFQHDGAGGKGVTLGTRQGPYPLLLPVSPWPHSHVNGVHLGRAPALDLAGAQGPVVGDAAPRQQPCRSPHQCGERAGLSPPSPPPPGRGSPSPLPVVGPFLWQSRSAVQRYSASLWGGGLVSLGRVAGGHAPRRAPLPATPQPRPYLRADALCLVLRQDLLGDHHEHRGALGGGGGMSPSPCPSPCQPSAPSERENRGRVGARCPLTWWGVT